MIRYSSTIGSAVGAAMLRREVILIEKRPGSNSFGTGIVGVPPARLEGEGIIILKGAGVGWSFGSKLIAINNKDI
jgi:hypothetical protein